MGATIVYQACKCELDKSLNVLNMPPYNYIPYILQDHATLQTVFRKMKPGELFEDPDFPATNQSMYYSKNKKKSVRWMRPHVNLF